jgi:glucose-6-phosphate isomerase
VGLYAGIIGINAYDQPGVEAGKKAAASVLALQSKGVAALTSTPQTADQIAAGVPDQVETVYLLLDVLTANGKVRGAGDGRPGGMTFCNL